MQATVKAKWLAALRAPDAPQQCRYKFADNDGSRCPFGILCAVLDEPVLLHKKDGNWVGNWQAIEAVLDEHAISDITYLNDVKMASFAEIADWIEENVRGT